jgi:hypothetical protein
MAYLFELQPILITNEGFNGRGALVKNDSYKKNEIEN